MPWTNIINYSHKYSTCKRQANSQTHLQNCTCMCNCYLTGNAVGWRGHVHKWWVPTGQPVLDPLWASWAAVIQVVGIPKTIDNDIPMLDCTFGYGLSTCDESLYRSRRWILRMALDSWLLISGGLILVASRYWQWSILVGSNPDDALKASFPYLTRKAGYGAMQF